MSEYGLKIKNYQAGSIYGYNLGLRNTYDCKNAMFTNNLFADFLLENGLDVYKGKSTRDIICIDFDYGTRSYEKEVTYLKRKMNMVKKDKLMSNDEKKEAIKRYQAVLDNNEKNKDKFKEISRLDLRTEFYKNGVDIYYPIWKKKEIIGQEKIHYKMLYRTTGKAKKGSCMFIKDSLYDIAIDFLRMGIQLPEKNSPIIEIGAYSSLITSTIVGKVKIDPSEILVIPDVDSFFTRDVISIETDENKHCYAIEKNNYKLKNTLFDGQGLIDSSIFPEWGDGYILLRHHFTKMACFNTNMQQFFKDYFGESYETATVTDYFGREVQVSKIKMITTDNALKWLKFDISFDYWAEWVRKNGCNFGIVKTAHPSKLGSVQKMSYQMVNSLNLDKMDMITKTTKDYIVKLKTDDEEFLDYLKKNSNFSNDFDVLVALVEQDRDFLRSDYFRTRRSDIIKAYVLNVKSGKLIQEGDNLVIVGNPYAMLLCAVGESEEMDDTFSQEDGCIQCYTRRFADGEYLAEFRSPFNSRNNMGYLHNVYNEKLEKYFNLGRQIIAVNMIHTDFQDRNNGSDQDSDSLYVTNQKEIVECAKEYYITYPTIVNNIPKEANKYDLSIENFSLIDYTLSEAQGLIGESSNLALLCSTYTYNYNDQKYCDYVCILSVLAQVAIDNAKRKFDIALEDEIARIKNDMDISEHKYPKFWTMIKKEFQNKEREIAKLNRELSELVNSMEYEDTSEDLKPFEVPQVISSNVNDDLICPMNYLCDIEIPKFHDSDSTLPMSTFFVKYEMSTSGGARAKNKLVEEFIQRYSLDIYNYNVNYTSDSKEEYLLNKSNFEELVEELSKLRISKNYLGLYSWLIDRAFLIGAGSKRNSKTSTSNMNKNKSLLLKVLYQINPTALLSCFSKNIISNGKI